MTAPSEEARDGAGHAAQTQERPAARHGWWKPLLGGAVVIETVYGWPGMGRLALEAVTGRDFNVLLGVLLFSSLLVMVTNVAIDLLHTVLDPRIGAH